MLKLVSKIFLYLFEDIFFGKLRKFIEFILPPPATPPPPPSPSSSSASASDGNHDQLEEIIPAGLEVGLALFAAFTTFFIFSPSKPNDDYYPAYLTVGYIGITASFYMSLHFFISLGTIVLSFKIKCFLSFLCFLLSLLSSLRICLELPDNYNPYVWILFAIVMLLIVFHFWFDDPAATSFLVISAAPLIVVPVPRQRRLDPHPAGAATITRPITTRDDDEIGKEE